VINLFYKIKNKNLTEADKQLLISFKNLLGFYPKNLNLYKQALRHKSSLTIKEGVADSNERLEYLGDAVLGVVVAEYLFKKFPFKNEGQLTKIRSRIVSRENLGSIAKKTGIEKLVEKDINSRISSANIGGDALEALIGAIYLDQGFKKTKRFIVGLMLQTWVDIDLLEEKDTDYKSQIITWAQKEHKRIDFKLVREEGYHHQKTYYVELWANNQLLGAGSARTKKKAEQLASAQALTSLFNT
jgi:ribonuclease-3